MKKRNFSAEFKRESAQLVVDQNYTVADAASAMDVGLSTMTRWVKQLRDERQGKTPKASPITPEQIEIRELRKKLQRIEMENEILKKATVDSIGQRNSYVKTWGCGGFLNETNIYSRGKSLCFANNRANRMAKRPKPCLLDQNLPLRKLVLEKLEMKWSPEQISGWLRRTKPRQKTLRISPETIYKTLYFRSREALHHLNIQHLRRSHSLRHGRRHTRKGERGTINIVNGTPIHERSRNIDNRRSLGHWEGDLVSGTKNSHIATLVDRKSRYTIIVRLRGKDSVSVNQALTDKFLSLPSELRKSLTWDRGMELARHLEFTVSTGVKVYFCDPQSPWQRGTNENTNGLIRQYFPKKTCLAQYTQHELDLVAAQLNNRPRKTLKFKTPKEIIERGVALTD
ncbi:IS30 family transposase [Escherichia coli]|nr:IS30 family transposase [Escherichia coli]